MGQKREKEIIFNQPFNIRLDKFLSENREFSLSRAAAQRLIDNGAVTVNGGKVRASRRLKAGDRINVFIHPPKERAEKSGDIKFDILHEDKSILVVNKPPGLVVHPPGGGSEGTLAESLIKKYQALSTIGGPARPGIVHRLDKDTSGAILIAKDDRAHNFLAAQFKERKIKKRYLALVHGIIKPEKGSVNLPISRHPVRRKEMQASFLRGRKALTEWKSLKVYVAGFSLLNLIPHTGRTHQIRVHMAYLGHPVVGDCLYGYGKRWGEKQSPDIKEILGLVRRQMLHAEQIGFVHPESRNYLELQAPIPNDMKRLIDWLGKKEGKADTEKIPLTTK